MAGATLAAPAVLAVAQDKPAQPPPPIPTPPSGAPGADKPAPTGDQPKLVLSQNEWDFGTKWYGEKCEGSVTLKNEGKADLTVVNVKTSCGCTVAKPKSGGVWQNKV